jgi:hypothetical protein
MKGISNALIFDTETATLVVSLTNCEYGNSDIYRTKKGNYFIHIHESEENEGEYLEYLSTKDLEETINEWQNLESGNVEIIFDAFEIG